MEQDNGQILLRMHCGNCGSMLACGVDRRHEAMLCPLCGRLAPLVKAGLPADGGEADITPVNGLPLARHPGTTHVLWRRAGWFAACFLLGFFAYAVLYALDGARPFDRLARRLINVARTEVERNPAPPLETHIVNLPPLPEHMRPVPNHEPF